MSSILEGLNPQQKEAVLNDSGPLLILAGAGSGKTRVITRKIAHLIEDKKVRPDKILAVTFTNKAAREMTDRINSILGDVSLFWMGTFHSIASKILRIELPGIGKRGDFSILDSADQKSLIRDCIKDLNIDDKKYSASSLLYSISSIKNKLKSPGEFAAGAHGPYPKMLANVYELYQQKLERNRGKDFDDLIVDAVVLLRENPNILEKYQKKFDYVLIDEYQDVNYAQYMLAKYLAGDKRNITVVGDDDQSIYGFRGADVSIILKFEKDFPGAKIIKLEENYRSSNVIIDASNAVISNNKNRKKKKLWTSKKAGEKIGSHACTGGREEARFVVNKIKDWMERDKKFKDFAILYRTNSQSRAIEEVLKQEGILYNIIGGLRFYERAEVKDAISYIRFISNPLDYVSFRRIVNVPHRGIGSVNCEKIISSSIEGSVDLLDVMERASDLPRVGKKLQSTLSEFAVLIKDLRKDMHEKKLSDFINIVLEKSGYFEMIKQEQDPRKFEKLENLDELISDAREFENFATEPTLEAFLEKIALFSDIDEKREYSDKDEGKVTLMTAHMAKGLEFPVVFIVGLEENIFPHLRTIEEGSPTAMEEERRLFYVAITRAIEKVYVTYARERTLHGKTHHQSPSRFLREIPEGLIDHYMPEVSKRSFSRRVSSILDKEKPGAAKKRDKFKEGDTVYHKIFGEGEVRSSDKGYVTVSFKGYGNKILSQDFLNESQGNGREGGPKPGDRVTVDGSKNEVVVKKLDDKHAYVICPGGEVEKVDRVTIKLKKD